MIIDYIIIVIVYSKLEKFESIMDNNNHVYCMRLLFHNFSGRLSLKMLFLFWVWWQLAIPLISRYVVVRRAMIYSGQNVVFDRSASIWGVCIQCFWGWDANLWDCSKFMKIHWNSWKSIEIQENHWRSMKTNENPSIFWHPHFLWLSEKIFKNQNFDFR